MTIMLTNIKPVSAPSTPAVITDPATIRAALRASKVVVGPDPMHDGEWAATVEYAPVGCRALPMVVHLVAFSEVVRAYTERGTLSAGRLVRIEGGALVLEGDEGPE